MKNCREYLSPGPSHKGRWQNRWLRGRCGNLGRALCVSIVETPADWESLSELRPRTENLQSVLENTKQRLQIVDSPQSLEMCFEWHFQMKHCRLYYSSWKLTTMKKINFCYRAQIRASSQNWWHYRSIIKHYAKVYMGIIFSFEHKSPYTRLIIGN